MQSTATQNLYKFFSENVGTKLGKFKETEDKMMAEFENIFEETDGLLDEYSANGLIFGLCEWPPLIKKVESGNALMEIVPEKIVYEFIEILYPYLNEKFPGKYIYDRENHSISEISDDEDAENGNEKE